MTRVLLRTIDLETTGLAPLNTLCQWTKEPKFLPRCPIGKWRGREWADVERSYLDWLLKTPDMDGDVQYAARRELDRRAA